MHGHNVTTWVLLNSNDSKPSNGIKNSKGSKIAKVSKGILLCF